MVQTLDVRANDPFVVRQKRRCKCRGVGLLEVWLQARRSRMTIETRPIKAHMPERVMLCTSDGPALLWARQDG